MKNLKIMSLLALIFSTGCNLTARDLEQMSQAMQGLNNGISSNNRNLAAMTSNYQAPRVGSYQNRFQTSGGYQTPTTYQGSYGGNYQYDTSTPTGQIRYSTDVNAQQRDTLSTDVSRNLDRGVGQYGGGSY